MKPNHEIAKGIVVAMLTPLNADETIDVTALEKMIERMASAHIHGIFSLSTTGETARLLPAQQRLLLESTARINAGRCLLYVGISGCGTTQALHNMERAEKLGADAFVCTLPYFFNAMTPGEQIDFFSEIATRSPKPIVVYNMPGNVGNAVAYETLDALKAMPNIAGVKDSSGDIEYFDHLLSMQSDDFRVLSGIEFHASRVLKKGASGLVPSLANIYPHFFIDLWNAAQANDFDAVDRLQAKLDRINSIHKQHIGRLAVPQCRKVLLAYEGIGGDTVTRPNCPLPAALRDALIDAAKELRLQ